MTRADRPGAKHDTCAILVGPEGIGKSTFWRELAGRDDWFFDGLDLAANVKEQIESLSGHVIVEVAEMEGVKRADTPKLNSFITRTQDKARMAYGHARIDVPRTCLLVGTTNERDLLPVAKNQAGRRWLPIDVEGKGDTKAESVGVVRSVMSLQRDQAWAQAVHLVRFEKRHSGMPGDLEDLAAEVVKSHRKTNAFVEARIDRFLSHTPDAFTFNDVLLAVDEMNPNRWQNDVKQELESRGFKSKRVKENGSRVTRWYAQQNTLELTR